MTYSTETITESVRRLEDALITGEIARRPPRSPDLQAEHAALQHLANALSGEPAALLQQLVESACRLCKADTAGVSVASGENCRWLFVGGSYAAFAGRERPCSQSPCGICPDRCGALLFTAPGRYFASLTGVSPPVAEMLILPLTAAGETMPGSLWIATHNTQRRFDAEDQRILSWLAGFAGTALRTFRFGQSASPAPDSLQLPLAERRISESKTKEALARLEAILNTVADGIITIDDRGRIESVNHAAEQIFGYPAAALIGTNISMLMPEPVSSAHDDYIHRYLYSGERRDNIFGRREVVGRRSDGSVFPLEIAISEPRLADRRIFTGILRDITERKRAEDEITRHLQELRAANEELARFNRAAVDRELRMIELKKQVNELCVQSGQSQRYRVDFDGHPPLEESR